MPLWLEVILIVIGCLAVRFAMDAVRYYFQER